METLALIEEAGGNGVVVVGDVSSGSTADETVATALKEIRRGTCGGK